MSSSAHNESERPRDGRDGVSKAVPASEPRGTGSAKDARPPRVAHSADGGSVASESASGGTHPGRAPTEANSARPSERGSAHGAAVPGSAAVSDDDGQFHNDEPSASKSIWNGVKETVLVIATALLISLLIKTFIFQMFYIPSESMEDTLTKGDRVVVSQFEPGLIDLKRGDVIVFRDPGNWLPNSITSSEGNSFQRGLKTGLTMVGILPAGGDEHLIKRLIGMPGDQVRCCNTSGQLEINGEALQEPYVAEGSVPSEIDFQITVPDGRYFVMGDNRGHSQDSRFNGSKVGNGTVAHDDVVGRATMIAWPINRWTWLSNYQNTFVSVPEPDAIPAREPEDDEIDK